MWFFMELFPYAPHWWSLCFNNNGFLTTLATSLLLACESLIFGKKIKHRYIDKKTCAAMYIIAFLSSYCFFLPHLSKDSSFLLSQRIFKAYFNILSDASTLTTSKPLSRSKIESILKKMSLLEIFVKIEKENQLNFKSTVTQHWVNVFRPCNKCYCYRD